MAQITIATLTDLDGALDALQGVHLRAVKGTQLQKDQVVSVVPLVKPNRTDQDTIVPHIARNDVGIGGAKS
jgi:hypothetical protein